MTSWLSTPPTTGLDEALTGEMLFVGLLGRLLYTFPDRDWYQLLLDEGVFAEVPFGAGQPDVEAGLALVQNWQRTAGSPLSAQAFAELQADYSRLFAGPGKLLAAPWESVYFSEERLLFQAQTLDVRAWYRRYGLEVAVGRQEPDDHIGLELAFLSHLAGLTVHALKSPNCHTPAALLAAQHDFLQAHLLCWGPAWCQEVEAHARTDFYRGVARMLRGVLKLLAESFELPAPVEVA
jgi:TorA maturation chaperone TorD